MPPGKSNSGPVAFIISKHGDKPDSNTMKLIRSHAMRGRNRGKVRRGISKTNKSELDPAESYKLFQRQSRSIIMKVYSDMPKKVGNDLSLVQFADNIDLPTIETILEFYSFGKHIMYNLEEVINMDVGLDLLVEPLTFDALYLHAQAFSVLSITELALRKRVKTHREVLSHLSKALQLLQDRLLVEDSSKFSINTVWVMLSLTAHAQISGDYEAVRTHIQGLHTVVSLNGGRSSCEIPKHILMEVLRYDLSLALNRGHQTVFFRNSQGEPLPEYPDFVLPTQVQGIGLSNATLSKMPVEIDYELGQAWEILKQFSEVMNLAYKSKYKQAKSTLHETMVAVMYRLLYMKFDPSSFDEAIRLGLLALSSNLFLQWKIGKPVYIDLPRSLKDCLLKLQISEGFNSILIWLMMIGAISVFTKADDVWLKPWLRVCLSLCKVESWEDTKRILEQFIWVGSIHDKPGYEILRSVLYQDDSRGRII